MVWVLFWLKTAEMYSFTILEAGSVKPRCQLVHVSTDGSRGTVPYLSQLLELPAVFGVPWLADAFVLICLFYHMAFSWCARLSLHLFSSLSPEKTCPSPNHFNLRMWLYLEIGSL